MLKQKSEKLMETESLYELLASSGYTVKMLTYDMIEGKAPICYLID